MHTFSMLLQRSTLYHSTMFRHRQSPYIMKHNDIGNVSTFGWFGGAFLSTSVQKIAILADPILTSYKVSLVAKSRANTTTQNTKYTTTKLSRRRSTLSGFTLSLHAPWVGQRHPQHMVLPLPMGPYQSLAALGSLLPHIASLLEPTNSATSKQMRWAGSWPQIATLSGNRQQSAESCWKW